MSYVHGFHGWGVVMVIGGEYVKFDGLSENQLDAFLNMDRYLADEKMDRYIPISQRNFSNVIRK